MMPGLNVTCSIDDFDRKFTKKEDPFTRNLIELFEDRMNRIIRFETKVLGDKFTLNGIANRRIDYNRYLSPEIEKYFSKRLSKEVFEATKNQDVADMHSDYLTIWDIYSLLKEITLNIKDIISIELKIMLKAFVILQITDFDDLILRQEKTVKMIDWLQEKFVMRFKDTVLNFDGFEKHFVTESANSAVWVLLNDLNIEKREISKYLDFIDKAIVYCVS